MKTVEERFWSKVDKTETCWLWTASLDTGGYGLIRIGGKSVRAHRYSWFLRSGPIPVGEGPHGICVLHVCDVRACVRPEHLFSGSQAVNLADMVTKGRSASGGLQGSSKLTETQVLEIRALYAMGQYKQKALGIRFGVSQSQISCAVNFKSWKVR